MKKVSSVLVLVFLSFIAVPAQQHTTVHAAAAPAGWINIAPANAGFTLLMPGTPTEKVEPIIGTPGAENHIFSLETASAGYVFSYVQFPGEVTDPTAIAGMLDAGREGSIAATGSKLKSEKQIRLKEHYGREWLLEMPGGFTALDRSYWVKRRFYQLLFITSPKPNDTRQTIDLQQNLANKFFDSFQVVDGN
ncbi:MAG TPA: hypothetical protein VIU65_02265 [Pyrinomonadaceae bacterium]